MVKGAKKGTNGPFLLRDQREVATYQERHIHVLTEGIRCATEKRGQQNPDGMSNVELVLDASEGFIPLWARGVILRWQFAEGTLQQFQDPVAAGAEIEKIFGQALLAWGDAAPIKFTKATDAWDFEIVVQNSDDCNGAGCVLASAFFPDAGRHRLFIYPMFFQQSSEEQLMTFCHEIGHSFGLRHFFALVSETSSPAELFGKQDKFTIMNYGVFSKLTATDIADLKTLYELAWSGQLTHINGTPIKFVKPYHEIPVTDGAFAMAAVRT